MKALLFLISLFITIYLSGCAGCSNSERKGQHSKRGREKPNLPINNTPKEREPKPEDSTRDGSTSKNIPSFKVIAIIGIRE